MKGKKVCYVFKYEMIHTDEGCYLQPRDYHSEVNEDNVLVTLKEMRELILAIEETPFRFIRRYMMMVISSLTLLENDVFTIFMNFKSKILGEDRMERWIHEIVSNGSYKYK